MNSDTTMSELKLLPEELQGVVAHYRRIQGEMVVNQFGKRAVVSPLKSGKTLMAGKEEETRK